jgi:hypothetical protein
MLDRLKMNACMKQKVSKLGLAFAVWHTPVSPSPQLRNSGMLPLPVRYVGWSGQTGETDRRDRQERQTGFAEMPCSTCMTSSTVGTVSRVATHHNAMTQTQQINKRFPLKAGAVGDPNLCMGAKLRKATLKNGVKAWSMSPSKCVQEQAVNNVKDCLQEKEPAGGPWLKKAPTPFVKDCQPKIHLLLELGPKDASCCMSQTGALHQMIELGRVDVITGVSMLSSQLRCPRDGCLKAVRHIFACLDNKHDSRMVFDPRHASINMGSFKESDWRDFCGGVSKPAPPNMPHPHGKEFEIHLCVDSDHASD